MAFLRMEGCVIRFGFTDGGVSHKTDALNHDIDEHSGTVQYVEGT